MTQSDRTVGGSERGLRVAVLAVHPESVAATRLRALQYQPHVAAQGVSLTAWSFLREDDLRAWYGSRQLGRVVVVLRALLRLPAAIHAVLASDAVLVQREALPFGPPLLELFAARRRPLVWDVDDAVWSDFTSPTAGRVPRWLRATGDKYRRLCTRADAVWAGSEVLAQWCRQHNANTVVVPTVVDVPEERPLHEPSRVVVWIGSHSTGPFLETVLPAMASIEPPPRVRVVGFTPRRSATGVAITARPWSPVEERDTLDAARVGLYPIDVTHPLAHGKCGLKAVLYMAHGIPPVVTPTVTNRSIVRNGVDGLWAETPEDWRRCVSRLLDDPDLWAAMSRSSHARARADYSIASWAPWWGAALRAVAEGRH